MAENKSVEIRLDQDRMVEVLTVGSLIAIIDLLVSFFELSKGGLDTSQPGAMYKLLTEMASNIKEAREFVSQFMWDGKKYLPLDEALPLANKMSIKDLIATVQAIAGQSEDLAVPQS